MGFKNIFTEFLYSLSDLKKKSGREHIHMTGFSLIKSFLQQYQKRWCGSFLGIIILQSCLVGTKLNVPHGDHVDEHAIITLYLKSSPIIATYSSLFINTCPVVKFALYLLFYIEASLYDLIHLGWGIEQTELVFLANENLC